MNTPITFTTKVGINRGRSRVWIEGARLTALGWLWHTSYSQLEQVDTILLTKDAAGSKKVAGRSKSGKDIPIIDLAGHYLDFMAGGLARVTITENTILIEKEPAQ